MNNIKIGIIGVGFVGNAVYSFYKKNNINVIRFDLDKSKADFDSLELFLNENPDCIFICVPTPQNLNDCDFSIVKNICLDIEEISKINNVSYNIIIKSTVSPLFLSELKKSINNCVLITSPEFLIQRTANENFENSQFLIWGCENNDILDKIINDLCWTVNFPQLKKVYRFNDIEMPMKFKYAHNVMGALNVLISNVMFDYIKDDDIYNNNFKEFLVLTEHFTDTYLTVPGYDNERGFGGACFPKDLNSFIYQINNDLNMSKEEIEFIELAQKLNNKLRKLIK